MKRIWLVVAALLASAAHASEHEILPADIPTAAAEAVTPPSTPTSPGTWWVGAARASLEPAPGSFDGTAWEQVDCTRYGFDDPPPFDLQGTHLVPSGPDEIRGWPDATPDCIYLGGYGLGPVRPAEKVGHGGVWARAIAISNGAKTFVYVIADTVGWFARYDARLCDDCGIRDVRERIAADLGPTVDVADVVVGSTHTHAGADTYGGWGGIPFWYRSQIRDAAIAAAKRAVKNVKLAHIDVGEVHLRQRNNERRDTYYSNADSGATWLQARKCEGTREEPCSLAGDVIATWTTFAAHPTIVSGPILHADWPGAAARRFEQIYGGGVGLVFEGGLGNVSVSGASGPFTGGLGISAQEVSAENTGIAIADAIIADIETAHPVSGKQLISTTMQAAVQDITHPSTTNPVLSGAALAGLFDREFTPGTKGAGLPGVYRWTKAGELSTSNEDVDVPTPELSHPPVPGELARGCESAGPTVITTAGAHRIGELVVAFAPGEIFSNIAEVVKERADNSAVTMVLGQTNDALGYIIQSFEYDVQGNVATEYATTTGEYEEVFSIDRCFGDHVLETLLESTAAVGAGR